MRTQQNGPKMNKFVCYDVIIEILIFFTGIVKLIGTLEFPVKIKIH